jgi:hypothetical protein
MNMQMNQRETGRRTFAACVGVEDAAAIFGWPVYYMPFLVRSGHLKPLGKPAQNGRKWFATVELVQHSQDRDWLDKAVRIVAKRIHEMNGKQRINEPSGVGVIDGDKK